MQLAQRKMTDEKKKFVAAPLWESISRLSHSLKWCQQVLFLGLVPWRRYAHMFRKASFYMYLREYENIVTYISFNNSGA